MRRAPAIGPRRGKGPVAGVGWSTSTVGPDGDRPATSVLDCGCGAGRFLRLAAARGATVAGIDAAVDLEIAAERTPEADLRVGDLEDLPWGDGSFDFVTGFSSFQFADDKPRAPAEARRVARRQVVVVIPTRVPEAAITQVFQPLFPLFPAEALEVMSRAACSPFRPRPTRRGARSGRPRAARRRRRPVAHRLQGRRYGNSRLRRSGTDRTGDPTLGRGSRCRRLRHALVDFTDDDGAVRLRGWYRVVECRHLSGGSAPVVPSWSSRSRFLVSWQAASVSLVYPERSA